MTEQNSWFTLSGGSPIQAEIWFNFWERPLKMNQATLSSTSFRLKELTHRSLNQRSGFVAGTVWNTAMILTTVHLPLLNGPCSCVSLFNDANSHGPCRVQPPAGHAQPIYINICQGIGWVSDHTPWLAPCSMLAGLGLKVLEVHDLLPGLLQMLHASSRPCAVESALSWRNLSHPSFEGFQVGEQMPGVHPFF